MKYYSIGEVCRILDIKPHVLRYWEHEILPLAPRKNHFGVRTYTRGDIRAFMRIKHLLYTRKYTIEGASNKFLEEMAGNSANRCARIDEMKETLLRMLDVLDSRKELTDSVLTDQNACK